MADQSQSSPEMTPEQQQWDTNWGKLVADVWADPALKKRLLSDPDKLLKERGLDMPAGIKVKVVENTPNLIHLTLPATPTADELSQEELSKAAGGHNCHHSHHCHHCGGHGGGHGGGGH